MLLGAGLDDLEDELLLRDRDVLEAFLPRELDDLLAREPLERGDVEVFLLGEVVLALELRLELGEFLVELLVGRDRAGDQRGHVDPRATLVTATATASAATAALG